MAALTPGVNPDATSRLYDALATRAGVRRPVLVSHPRVAADVIVRSDGSRFAFLVSQADEPLTVTPETAAGLSLAALDGTADGRLDRGTITLAPFGTAVLRLEGTG
jgi:hypothetical protein